MPETLTKERAAADGRADQLDPDREVMLARASEEEQAGHDEKWVETLAKRWKSHLGQDLKLRHETGVILNARIGPPDVRQPRGEGVIELLTEATGLSASDISRMRRFAFRFKTFADFKDAYGDSIRTWDDVRLLLVYLARPDKSDNAKGNGVSEGAKSKDVETIVRSLKTATATLRDLAVILDEDAQVDLVGALKKLSNAVKKATGVEIEFSLRSEEETIA